jgi:glycosyltransferase involved in cell wall biosynthesis
MRLLIVTNTYPPAEITGVGALVYELAQQLTAEGHDAVVLTREAPREDSCAVATGGRKILFPWNAGWRFLRLAREKPFDLVHVHESDGVLVALALRLARWFKHPAGQARLMVTLQVSYRRERLSVRPICADGSIVSRPTAGERLFAWGRAPLLSLLGRFTAQLAEAVVAPSRVTAHELEEDYGAQGVVVIPNGVPEIPETSRQNTDLERPVMLYAGRLRTRKAVAVLVEAFATLRHRRSASLVIAGDGEHREALEERVRALGLEGSVLFLGAIPRPDMLRWYATADIFCLPSLYEGFPVAILEAMAAGLPVVSTTVSGIPEAVADGATGLLVPPENATALAAALDRLAGNEVLRERMGEAGRRRVRETFAISKVCAAYMDQWQKLVDSNV